MKRKEDPVRYCELKSCGALLVRKEHPGGTEDYCHFIKRRFCDRKCGVAGRTRAERVKLIIRLRPDEAAALRAVAGRSHHGDMDRAIGALALLAKVAA